VGLLENVGNFAFDGKISAVSEDAQKKIRFIYAF
jgi:hypothetical protein